MEPNPPLAYPDICPEFGAIRLRPFESRDLGMVRDLASDPYVSQVSSVVENSDDADATAWLTRQRQRLEDGVGYSFCIARRNETGDDIALGQAGLWLKDRNHGRATAGYLVAPAARGAGVAGAALRALTGFAWTLPDLHRVELHIELWNTASLRTAAAAGYQREGLLRSHQVIGGVRVDMELWAAIRPRPTG